MCSGEDILVQKWAGGPLKTNQNVWFWADKNTLDFFPQPLANFTWISPMDGWGCWGSSGFLHPSILIYYTMSEAHHKH